MLKLFKFFNTETKVDKCLFSRHMCQALLPKQGGDRLLWFFCALPYKAQKHTADE